MEAAPDVASASVPELATPSSELLAAASPSELASAAAVPAAAPALAADAPALLPISTTSVALSCQGGSGPPRITGGPDVVGYSQQFTGEETTGSCEQS